MRGSPWVVAVALLASSAAAQDELPPIVSGRAIERATVRVLAMRGLDVVELEGAARTDRAVAVPELGQGSGLLVSADGLVVTAHHLVRDARWLVVVAPGERRALPAVLVHEDPARDLAVLTVGGEGRQHVAPTPSAARMGQAIEVVAHRRDARRAELQTSRGTVAGTLAEGQIVLDVAPAPATLGSPVVDDAERLLGLVVASAESGGGVHAQPTAVLRRLLDAVSGARNAEARATLASGVDGAVADVVVLLAQMRAAESMAALVEVVQAHRSAEVLPPLRSLAELAEAPSLLMLVSAYFWNVAAVAAELRDAERAEQLSREARELARRAAASDPELPARSRFAAHLVGRAVPAPSAEPAPRAPARAAVVDTERVPQAERPARPRGPDHRVHLGLALSLPHQAAPGFGIGGAAGSFIVDYSPYTLRAGAFAADLWIGGRLHLGGWGRGVLLIAGPEIGVGVRIGEAQGAHFGVTYAPAFGIGDGQSSAIAAGVRAYAGAYFDPVTIALGWEALGPPNGYALHLYQLLVTLGL
jgi:hypothetical protein